MSQDKDRSAQADQHNARGIELADRGWLDEAVKEFGKAIQLDPASAHPHDNLGAVYAEQKRYREALGEYLEAVRLEPDSAAAHHELGCFLAGHGPDLAVAELKEALAQEPGFQDAQLNLGMALADLGRTEEARQALEAAVGLDPADPMARHELAGLLLDEGDVRGAIVQLKEVTHLQPGNFEAHLDLGVAYAQKGFYAEAERCYARAGDLSPDDLVLNYDRAGLYALWGRPAEALEALRRAMSVDPVKVRGWLAVDDMFASLAGTAEFEALAKG